MRSLTSVLAALLLAAASLPGAAQAQANGKPVNGKPAARKPATAKSTAHKPAAKAAAAPAKTTVLAPVKLTTVKGVVLGPDNLALAGASVFPLGKPGQTVVTNQGGEFILTVPAALVPSVKLNVAYQGLGDWQVHLKDKRTDALFVTLLPHDL